MNKGQFKIGNPGKEKMFSSPEELESYIEEYFEFCDSRNKTYTIEGLALSLNTNRNTILNYESKRGYEPFFGIIKAAKQRIHDHWIDRALSKEGSAPMAIFLLKNNANYVDRIEQHNTGEQNINIKTKFG